MRTLSRAAIVAIGSELLTPHRIDTNSLYLSGRLEELGIRVRAKYVVGDDRDELAVLLRTAMSRSDLVILTGGLGPTEDDVTREVVGSVLGRPLTERPEVLEALRARFSRAGSVMPAINRRQALAPEGAVVLPNAAGTAPGLLVETADCLLILLPGPPRELQPMFDVHVAPVLAAHSGGRAVRRRAVKVTGRSESQVEELVQPIYSHFGTPDLPVDVTILASLGVIEVHLSCATGEIARADALLDDGVRQLVEALGDVVFSVHDEGIEAAAGAALAARGWTVAVAESCTGGLLLGRLTSVPGSSAWVRGGVVAYANDVKTRDLGVPEALIAEFGAVSEHVARAMAQGVRARLHADVGVGITGIAGPGGGSDAKPVGTVAIGIVAPGTDTVRASLFPGDRDTVRQRAVATALDLIRRAARH